jgi:hypothetical protein
VAAKKALKESRLKPAAKKPAVKTCSKKRNKMEFDFWNLSILKLLN